MPTFCYNDGFGTRYHRNDATCVLGDFRTLIETHTIQTDRYHQPAAMMTGSVRNYVSVPSDFVID